MQQPITLVADIGGTNVRFALVEAPGPTPVAMRQYRCADFDGLVDAARAYLQAVQTSRPTHGLFATAAPPLTDPFKMTNNQWLISIDDTRRALELRTLRFINDFAAQAMAIPALPSTAFEHLGGAVATTPSPIAVIGPGTGLGVASLIQCQNQWVAIDGEGGHVTYSPLTDREMAVAARVRDRFGHCSAERVISGPGLQLLYETLAQLDGHSVAAPEPATISALAADGSCTRAREALDLFLDGLATAAGNLALTVGARGGVYLSGGILPKLRPSLDSAAFRRRFEAKGRFASYLASIPTYLVQAPDAALRGLAFMASQRDGP